MTRRRWLAVGVGVLVVLVLVLAWRQASRVHICDAWTVELRDGTIHYAPGYEDVSEHPPYGPCWLLPEGVTREDWGH